MLQAEWPEWHQPTNLPAALHSTSAVISVGTAGTVPIRSSLVSGLSV